ncbi:MAG: ribbon-helix-helix protein, CopG family [Phycisphaerae bacterium]
MRSVRLDEELEERLEQAAEASGQAVSDIIRDGVRKRCDEILAKTNRERLADFIGAMKSGGRRNWKWSARDSSAAFGEIVRKKHGKRK